MEVHKEVNRSIENIWLWGKYFFFFPIFSLFPPPYPYIFSRFLSHLDYRYNSAKRELVKEGMTKLLNKSSLPIKELELTMRRYFEVIFCDELDIFIYLLGFSDSFTQRLKIEGEENLKEALKNSGGIFLSAHFGGGFWILPFLKDRGIKVHFFSADIKEENYPSKKSLYFYYRLRNWVVKKASGEMILYKKDGKEVLINSLKEGKWVIVLLDVPPFLVKENIEVQFLNKRAWFPKGIISIAKEMNSPIFPFFSFLDKGRYRRICFEKPFYVKDERECVKWCVRLIEERIIERPDHWHLWPFANQFFYQ